METIKTKTMNKLLNALKNGAEHVETKFIPFTDDEEIDKDSILNTFEETYLKYKI